MNKKLIVLVLVAIMLISGGVYVWQKNSADAPASDTTQTQQEAIQQAQQYQPPEGVMCTQSLVPAVHTATGARYTFHNGCLAPGWKAAP